MIGGRRHLRDSLRERGPLVVGLLKLVDDGLVEVLARAGCDVVAFDAEHGSIAPDGVRRLAAVATACGMSSLVRCHVGAVATYAQSVGPCVDGYQLAGAGSATELSAAVSALLFPPEGTRGVALGPPTAYAPRDGLASWTAHANQDLAVIAQLECFEILEDLDGVLAIDRIDCFYVGRVDLTAVSSWDAVRSDRASAAAEARIRAAGRAVAVSAIPGHQARDADAGCIIFPVEPALLAAVAERVTACRALLASPVGKGA